jgi:hypothetical protein
MPDLYPYRSLVIGLVVALLMAALHRLFFRHGARQIDHAGGEIAPNAALILATCAIGVAIAAAAFWATFTQPDSFPASVVGAGAVVLTLATGSALHPGWRIAWNRTGIRGPVTLLPRLSGPDQATLAWDSITAIGRDIGGNFFVEHWDGTRIRWNFTYGGYGHLMAAVERNCPHLFPGPEATA